MSLNILAVDDSRTMRDMVRLALAAAGMTVTTADDGVHGLEVLEGMEPDAIISDINMPRLDGFGFIRAVREIDRMQKSRFKPSSADWVDWHRPFVEAGVSSLALMALASCGLRFSPW